MQLELPARPSLSTSHRVKPRPSSILFRDTLAPNVESDHILPLGIVSYKMSLISPGSTTKKRYSNPVAQLHDGKLGLLHPRVSFFTGVSGSRVPRLRLLWICLQHLMPSHGLYAIPTSFRQCRGLKPLPTS